MTFPIPTWLQEGRTKPNDATLTRTNADRELDKLLAAKKAEGYLECVKDLQDGFKKHNVNSFALISIARVMRTVMLKAECYMELVK